MSRTYNANDVFCSFAALPVDGWGDGDFISIEREAPLTEDMAGVDGEVTISRIHDNRATVTLTLQQSSPMNDALSALMQAQGKGVNVGEFFLEDHAGTSTFAAESAWIQTPPNATFGRTAGTRDWVLRVAKLQEWHGGNHES